VNVLEKVRRWLGGIVALHQRSPAEREELKRLPAPMRAYLIASCFVVLYALARVAIRDILAVAALTCVYALTMLVPPITSPLGQIRIPRLAFTATIALLWSPLHTFVGVACGTLLGVFAFGLYEPWRAVLNSVLWAYPAALASFAGHAVFRAVPDPLLGLTVAGVVIVVVYWVTNYGATALWRHWGYGAPFFRYWWRGVAEDPLGQILSAPLPIFFGAIALGLGSRPWIVLLLTGLAALMMPTERAQRMLYFASQRTTSDIVRALMLALERLVPGARAHAERVSALVTAAGQTLGVPPRTLEVWRQAGLLHDVGLVDAGGRAAAAEEHARLGARILASHPDPAVAEIVRRHHTPWSDAAVARQSAVLGARVLAAAERYDELRYGTPGTPGLGGHAAAAEALKPLGGTLLDPVAVAAVIEAARRLDLATAS